MADIAHMAQGAAKYVAGHFKSHTETSRARLAVCDECDQLTPSRQCAICQCKVDQKVKYPSENCPLARVMGIHEDFWNPLTSEHVRLLDKWGTSFEERVPRGFARQGDIIIHPTHKTAINLRSQQRARVEAIGDHE